MRANFLALTLLLFSVALAVFGGWLKRPSRLRDRGVVWLFVIALAGTAALTYMNATATPRAQPNPTTAPTEASHASQGPVEAGLPSTNRPVSNPGTPTKASRPTAASTSPTPRSPFISADRFVRFGGTQGAFTMQASGSKLDISVPNQDMNTQWGGALRDHEGCSTTVEFDVSVNAGAVDYYGFAVLPRGSVVNDHASGDGIGFYADSDGLFVATLDTLPNQPLGGIGGGSYPVADLRTTRHVVVAAKGGTHTVTVDGTPAGDFAEIDGECGEPVFAAWGGITVHIDHVLIH